MNILFFISSFADHQRHVYSDDLLMDAHCNRGDKVFVAEPKHLIYTNNKLILHARSYRNTRKSFVFSSSTKFKLSHFQFIYFRPVPPLANDTLHATYLLDSQPGPFCNHPTSIRDCNEKLLALEFNNFMPPTIISSGKQDFLDFAKKVEYPIIIKPLDGYQSKGIQKINNHSEIPEIKALLMGQAYLKDVEKNGSKRIFLLDGEMIGAVSFFPEKGGFKTNDRLVVESSSTTLNKKELTAIKSIAPILKERQLRFVALDFIDGYLMEINLTSPGGITEYNESYGSNLENSIVEKLMKDIKT
jgi:glutathione synthase